MTVKELINKLLDCKMDAEVVVLVEIDRETICNVLDGGTYKYPIDDDINVEEVNDMGEHYVRICLEEFKR